MDEHDWMAERFEEHRTHLRAVAYRMLGSRTEADDAVQESWIRLSRSGASGVENLGGWLTTVTARVCLDMLRSRRSRREEPVGVEVPEPAASRQDAAGPEQEVLLADSVGLALLVVLEALAPAERVAFVLHDMFDMPFDQIGPIVGRSPAAARQLASRARRRVQGSAAAPDADLARQREVVGASWPPRAAVTSPRWSRCSTRRWCADDAQPCGPRGHGGRGGAPSRPRPGAQRARERGLGGGMGPGRPSARGIRLHHQWRKIVDLLADPERIRQLDLVVLGRC
jgi:RNA polymerase sigma factor (sigma-70 family)